MGLFSRGPDRATQAELLKQARNSTNWFGFALMHKRTNAPDESSIDLTVEENRIAIRREVVRLIQEYQLMGCTEAEIGGDRLVPLSKDAQANLVGSALVTVLAINSISLISRYYYEKFPRYRPLLEMVNNLAKVCCPGAAQMIGEDLPEEVSQTWPYFARMFSEAKAASLVTWPNV